MKLAIHLLAYNAQPCPDDGVAGKTGAAGAEDEIAFLESLPDRYFDQLPERLELERAYPNPFNPVTTIGFTVPEASEVRLVVYDLLGCEVRVLVDGNLAAGHHEARFEAMELPSGTYLYRIETSLGTTTGQAILMK